ncbi:MAG: VIT1/CCC1 transporter family protein [Propionibacteriaceae bacterium]|nr:VIT1/CCC1 transporter family protein [Propionibacteriaceae bacterium]
MSEATARPHAAEPHGGGLANRLNWLRAGVLGANDGIVSVAAIAVGVAGATPALAPVLTAGMASLVGGAISMALGEYVSVSSQRDSEHALIAKEKHELAEMPREELVELTGIYQDMGLSHQTARQVAEELTAKDALAAHLSAELNIDAADIVSPWRAAFASAFAFLVGGALPLLAILATGAYLGQSRLLRPTLRVVCGGALALAATFFIGRILGTAGVV